MKLYDKLPHYRSHKVVAAAKVLTASTDDGSQFWEVTLEGVEGLHSLAKARCPNRSPEGGYLVVYRNADGSGEYISWSPAAEFEAGNSLLIGETE